MSIIKTFYSPSFFFKTICFFIVLSILGNFISKYLDYYNIIGFSRFSAVANALLFLFVLTHLIGGHVKLKYFYYASLLFVLGLIRILWFDLKTLDFPSFLTGQFYTLIIYVSIIAMADVFLYYKGKISFKKIFKYLKYLIYLNSIFIVYSIFFETDYFLSYPLSERFGFCGLFKSPGLLIFIYIFIIIVEYKNIQISKKYIEITYLIVLGCFLGKKSFFLFLILLAFSFIKNIKKILILSFATITFVLIFKEKLIFLLEGFSNYWYSKFIENDIITLLSSERNILLNDSLVFLSEKATFVNYMIGINYTNRRVEFDFWDLLLFFGVIGFIVFCILIKKLFLNFKSNEDKVLIYIIFAIAFLSGGLLNNFNAFLLFLLLSIVLEDQFKEPI